MKTVTKRLYEGMFLVDPAQSADWDAIVRTLEGLLERVEAEIVSIRKWDERKLAYEIDRQSRGTYILVYFRADGARIQEIERSVRLSDKIMRLLILSAEHMTAEDIEKDTPATKAEKAKQKQKAAAEAEPEQKAEPEQASVPERAEEAATADTSEETDEAGKADEAEEPQEPAPEAEAGDSAGTEPDQLVDQTEQEQEKPSD